MSGDQAPSRVEGWAMAMGAFQAYLDYVIRDEIAILLASGSIETEEAEVVAGNLKQAVMQHMADDISEHLPNVFGDISARIAEAAKLPDK